MSNEQPTQTDVYFDDVKITYTPTNILQYNEYYAHGAPNARSWTRDNTTTNSFLANGGTELNTTTALYDLEYRNYDPILGRMNGVDPMADKYGSLTPYNYSFNSPTMHNDVSGADPTDQTPYWIEESMQRNARRYKGEVIDTYNQFAGLIRTFGVSLSEQRMVGGYTGTGNNSPYLMPLGEALQTVHDAFDLTREQFIDKYAERVTGSIEYDRSASERYRVSLCNGYVTGVTRLATAYMMNNMIASMKNDVANFGQSDPYVQKTQTFRLNAGIGVMGGDAEGRVVTVSAASYSMSLTVSVFKAGVFDNEGNLDFIWRAKVSAVSFVSASPGNVFTMGSVSLIDGGSTLGKYTLISANGSMIPTYSGQYSYVGERYIDLPNSYGNVQLQFFGSWMVDNFGLRQVPFSLTQPLGLSVSKTITLH